MQSQVLVSIYCNNYNLQWQKTTRLHLHVYIKIFAFSYMPSSQFKYQPLNPHATWLEDKSNVSQKDAGLMTPLKAMSKHSFTQLQFVGMNIVI